MTRPVPWLVALALLGVAPVAAQEVERPGPPRLEDFETDADGDGVPDGWYNLRDAERAEGGIVGPTCLRFENPLPGRPARASRAFGVDGRQFEALIVGLWVRGTDLLPGERIGEDAGLLVEMLGEDLRSTGRGIMGPWTATTGDGWLRVAKRIAVPPGTRDAILTLGLLGATGMLEVDGLTIEAVPRGGSASIELVLNGGFELGDPLPEPWVLDGGAARIFPGHESDAALALDAADARAMVGVALPVDRFRSLEVRLSARGTGLRGSGGASAELYFVDEGGRPLAGRAGGARLFVWSGAFAWRAERLAVDVPRGASRAVLQVEKLAAAGRLEVDDVSVSAAPDPAQGRWTPYHVADETAGWPAYEPAAAIEPGSALDASYLLDAPAGGHGFVDVKEGHLSFADGTPARFFGVALLPPVPFQEAEAADALADRLARSGVNLVRFVGLDAPIGPEMYLLDDARDDTRALDANALAKFDHLVAALRSRGIYLSVELQLARRFRPGDEVAGYRALPPGGGPAAAFDPAIRARVLETAESLLAHVNPETGLALRDDPALAWVTLAGELSLFDLLDDPSALPPTPAAALRERAGEGSLGSGRRFWEATESAQWSALAAGLREIGLKVPIAGSSHWRREPEFNAAQAADGLDLIDDRLYWAPPSWTDPDRRSLLLDLSPGRPSALAAAKRRRGHPYVVGQWAEHTLGAWALPFEGADSLLMAATAAFEGWDALVRRGVTLYPRVWGVSAAGTGGGQDIFPIPEAVNGIPPVFALWPHAAAVLLRDAPDPGPHRGLVPGWDGRRGRLALVTPHTVALAGWPGDAPAASDAVRIDLDSRFGVVAASSAGPEPLDEARRILVTAIARVEPTGLLYDDTWRLGVADPGRPPLLQEPVRGSVTWRRDGPVTAFTLDNAGRRVAEVPLQQSADGPRLILDGRGATVHWELVAGPTPRAP